MERGPSESHTPLTNVIPPARRLSWRELVGSEPRESKEALAERIEKLSRVRILEAIRGFQGLYLQTLS